MKSLRLSACLLLTSAVAAASLSHDDSPAIFPKTVLALPIGVGIRSSWVMHPIEKGLKDADKVGAYRFDVDPTGMPWFADARKRLLVNPLKDVVLLTDVPFSDFVWLDGGDRLLCTDSALGVLSIPLKRGAQENGIPVVKFAPMLKLPHSGSRLFPAGEESVYVLWKDPDTGVMEISLLSSKDGIVSAKKLIDSELAIAAVAGDGNTTYFASDRTIYRWTKDDKYPHKFFTAVRRVTGLAYSAGAGLFYATPGSVGYLSPHFHMEILRSPSPQITMRRNTLYIRLAQTFGVIRIDGAERFKTLRAARHR